MSDEVNHDSSDDLTGDNDNTLTKIALPISVAIIGLSVGVSLEMADFRHLVQHPVAAALGCACQLILVPAVGWLIATAFQLRNELAVGMVLLTTCPGGSSSNYVSVVAGGDGALSVSLTMVSSIVTTFTIPLLLEVAIRTFMDEDRLEDDQDENLVNIRTGKIIGNIALLTLFPVAAGMGLRALYPKCARRSERPLKVLAALLLTAIVAAFLVTYWHELVLDAIRTIAGPTALLIVLMISLSYLVGWTWQLAQPQRITICVEASIQYSGLAVTIGLTMLDRIRDPDNPDVTLFRPEKTVMPAAVYTLFMYPVVVAVIFYCWWLRGVLLVPMACPCTNTTATASKRKETADESQEDAPSSQVPELIMSQEEEEEENNHNHKNKYSCGQTVARDDEETATYTTTTATAATTTPQ